MNPAEIVYQWYGQRVSWWLFWTAVLVVVISWVQDREEAAYTDWEACQDG